MIITPIALASGITFLSEIIDGEWHGYIIIAMIFVIIMLLLLEQLNAQLATVFAWIILAGVVYARGPALMKKIGLI